MSEIKVDKDTRNIADLQHNHFTRDVKEWGECPACDDYHKSELIRKYKSRITQQEEIIGVLEEAVRYYADKDHYRVDKNHARNEYFTEEVMCNEGWDVGKNARMALAAVERINSEEMDE